MARDISLQGAVFAKDAATVIPPSPVVGTTYRDETLNVAEAGKGWPFKTIVDSAEFNEMLYRVSGVLNDVEKRGLLDWSSLTDYPVGGLTRGATNGVLYECIVANGPNSGGTQEPESNPTHWKPATFGAGSTVRFVTGNTTASQNEAVYCVSGSLTVTLPVTVTEGAFVRVATGTGISDVNKVTITGSAIDVAGTTSTEIAQENAFIDFYWDGTNSIWRTVKGGAGGGGSTSTSRAVFELFYSVSSETPPGAMSLATGSVIANCDTTFPDFWTACNSQKVAGTIRTLTEAEWQAEATANGGDCGAFVIDGTAKSVRLPKITSYLRSGTAAQVGTYLADELKSHTHDVTGAKTIAENLNFGGDRPRVIPSTNTTTATGGDETRPKTVYGCLYIQVYTTAIPASVAQANQFVNLLQNRAQNDLSNITATGAAKIGKVLSLGTVTESLITDTIYTATADGIASITGTATTASYIVIEASKGIVKRSTSTMCNKANNDIALYLPVYAGEQYKINATGVTSASIQFIKNNGIL